MSVDNTGNRRARERLAILSEASTRIGSTLDVMQTRVESSKIDLGIAGYGYTWPRQGTGKAISTERARELVVNFGALTWMITRSKLPRETSIWSPWTRP